jgi:uncharacterized protein (TIGR02996 family)
MQAILDSIVSDPDPATWLVLADWLEEHDDPRRAELVRLHQRLLDTCCEPDRHPERAAWQGMVVELLGQGVRPCVPQRTVLLGGVELTFSFIPPGKFLMGSPEGEQGRRDDEPLHRVSLPRGFWLGIYPVTQAQWTPVMGNNPSRFKGKGRPVERVTWDECRQFCNLTALPCRLPREAEWEWACRAGTTTPFWYGATLSTEQANYDGEHAYGNGPKGAFRNRTTLVGSFTPNAWGLYDVHGNVWEWCEDTCTPYPATALTAQDRGAELLGFYMLRGGCWRAYPVACRAAARHHSIAGYRTGLHGFRVCLEGDGSPVK